MSWRSRTACAARTFTTPGWVRELQEHGRFSVLAENRLQAAVFDGDQKGKQLRGAVVTAATE